MSAVRSYVSEPASAASTRPAAETDTSARENTSIPFQLQCKLTVGAPDDPYEREADAVADRVMRMPEQNVIQRKCTSCEGELIQREENEEKEPADKSKLSLQLTEPDFLSLRTPFFERNAMHLWDPESALGVWKYNFDFFRRFGLDDTWSGKAANLTAPFFINSQLKVQNPTWWEVTDRQLNTTSIVGSLPLFNFDSDFRNWKPLPFLQKKSLEDNATDEDLNNSDEDFIQRKCEDCEEEEQEVVQPKLYSNRSFIQRQCEECKKEKELPLPVPTMPIVQAKTNGNSVAVSDSVQQSIERSRGEGSFLDTATSRFMSDRIGADFSGVKIHADSNATQTNREINARAFTVGNNIYFNEGQYQPHTDAGKRLLAHELTHVVQQGKAASLQTKINRKEQPAPVGGSVCDQHTVTPVTTAVPADASIEDKVVTKDKAEQPKETPGPAQKAPAGQPALPAPDEKTKEPAEGATLKNSNAAADPAFREILSDTKKQANRQKDHEKPGKKTSDATNAVHVEDSEAVKGGTTVLTVNEDLNSANKQPREFNSQRFKDELKIKIRNQVPQEEKGAREFIKNDSQANAIVEDTKTGIKQSEKQVVNDAEKISNKNAADTTKQDELAAGANISYTPEAPGSRPAVKDPARAVPKPVPDEDAQMDEEHNADSLDKKMAENNMSDNQLAESEEPQFIETLQEKQKSQQELCQVPAKMRTAEMQQMHGNTAEAQAMMNGAMGSMFAKRKGQLGDVEKGQKHVQTEEEKQLQHYFDQLKGIYQTTETNVKNTLTYLECMVACTFQDAIDKAFATFKKNVTDRLDYYYDWHIVNPDYEKEDKMTRAFVNAPIEEKIAELKSERDKLDQADPRWQAINNDIKRLEGSKAKLRIERIFEEEKALFIGSLDTAIDSIAIMVADGLNEAKAHINKGKSAMDAEYSMLSSNNQQQAKDATEDFKSKLNDLEDKVNDKEAELSDSLAKQYVESADKLKSTFEDIRKEAALSWWERAWRKIKEIATIIFDIAKLLLNILVKAASVIGDIVAHPIRFFGNLIEGVSTGFKNFVRRLPEHLEAIIFKLVMGVVPPGITLPEKWDAEGLFSFVLDFLGLSKKNIREQAVKRFGLPVVEKLEQGFELFMLFREKGFAGLWEHIKEKIGNLKDAIIEEVKTFFKESIIKAAVEFLLSALTPASGFIKVCKSIINLVMFLVKNLQNILKLLESILDSFADIAVGKIEKAAQRIETAIADVLLIGIKFLAALVGINLDKIQTKITKIINAVRNPVNRALKWFFDKAEAFARKSGLLGLIEKGRGKIKAGKEWAKGKVEAGKAKVKEAASASVEWLGLKMNFKSKDGGKHQIFFKGSKKQPVLMVASNNPTPVETLLKSRQATDSKAASAYHYYTSIVKTQEQKVLVKEQLYINATKEGKRAARYEHQVEVQNLRENMKEFADLLSMVTFEPSTGATIRTKVKKDLLGNRAHIVEASPLTYLPGDEAGSPPSQDPPGWKNYAQNASDKWVRGHLLSEHLHGPGLNWNLVPVSQSVNSKMTGVENLVKPFLKDQTNVLFYKTTAYYDDSRTSVNEKAIPETIVINWGTLERDDSDPAKFKEHAKAPVKASQGLPSLSGPPNLNIVGRVEMNNNGITIDRLSREVIRCRDEFEETDGGFDNYPDLINKLTRYYANQLTPKSGSYPDKWFKTDTLNPSHVEILYKAIMVDKTLKIE